MKEQEALEIIKSGEKDFNKLCNALAVAVNALEKQVCLHRPGMFTPCEEAFFERIENALGFKLFIWQKTYIATGFFRQFGKTTAECLKELLDESKINIPLDYSHPPKNPREQAYKHQLKEIYIKLTDAGIKTRNVFWSEREKRKYYYGLRTDVCIIDELCEHQPKTAILIKEGAPDENS